MKQRINSLTSTVPPFKLGTGKLFSPTRCHGDLMLWIPICIYWQPFGVIHQMYQIICFIWRYSIFAILYLIYIWLIWFPNIRDRSLSSSANTLQSDLLHGKSCLVNKASTPTLQATMPLNHELTWQIPQIFVWLSLRQSNSDVANEIHILLVNTGKYCVMVQNDIIPYQTLFTYIRILNTSRYDWI